MRSKQIPVLIGLAASLALLPWSTARAERPGVYLGAAWGAYSIEESALDDNDDVLRAFAGLQFTDWFAVEGSWTDFNRLDSNNNRFEADGQGLAGVFSIPLGRASSLFAKVGQFWWETDSSIGGVVADQDGNDPFFGAGLRVGFNEHISLRLEVERYDVANIDLDTASIGLQFKF
jgi:OOP family OmpA-OmpF porin